MTHRAEVPKFERLRLAASSLVGIDGHFDVGRFEVEESGDQVGLKAEAVRVGMPSHHVVAEVHRQAVVVADPIPAQQVDDQREAAGDTPAERSSECGVGRIGDDHVGLAHPSEDRDERLLRLDIVATDHSIVLAATAKRGLGIVGPHTLIHLVHIEGDGQVGMPAEVVDDQLDRPVRRAVVHDHDVVADAHLGRGSHDGVEGRDDALLLVVAGNEQRQVAVVRQFGRGCRHGVSS